MQQAQAQALAESLINKHLGDTYPDLTFKWKNSKQAIGTCVFLRATGEPTRIELSKRWVEVLDEAEVRDTILHEIAHAIAGHQAGHGTAWKAACRRLGARPERLASLEDDITTRFHKKNSKYRVTCETCDFEHYINRYGRKWQQNLYLCPHCRTTTLSRQPKPTPTLERTPA